MRRIDCIDTEAKDARPMNKNSADRIQAFIKKEKENSLIEGLDLAIGKIKATWKDDELSGYPFEEIID